MKAELVIDSRGILSEGPVWDAQSLWWVDIEGKLLHRYNSVHEEHTTFSLPEKVGSFSLQQQGGMVMAGEQGWSAYEPETGAWRHLADPELNQPSTRFNDGKCDRAGRFIAGTASLRGESEGALYSLHADGSWHRLLEGVTCSNGITWSPDDRTMYYIDSYTYKVDALDYDIATGQAANRRTILSYEGTGILPDGMTADEEGLLWIAEWGGSKVSRWNPGTGERILTVEVSATNVTSCTFGGPQLDELWITTARSDLSDSELKLQPYAGSIFRAKVGIRGRACHPFVCSWNPFHN